MPNYNDPADAMASLIVSLICDSGNYPSRVVARSEADGYVIDTAYTTDAGYETAIWYGGYELPMVVVEYYEDRGSAEAGHKAWVDYCKSERPLSLYSAQLNENCCIRMP